MAIFCFSCLRYSLALAVIILSATAIFINQKGNQFDPLREIQQLKSKNRRDDALDLIRFLRHSQNVDFVKLNMLEKELQYTRVEKFKSFAWNGVIKGEVYDTYSGIGAISADLCAVGDLRDLGIQSWRYLTGTQDFDKLIMALSAGGICLSTTPYLDGINAFFKNTLKYLKRIPGDLNRGLLRKFLIKKISPQYCKKIWELLKKTSGPSREPHPASPISTA